MRPDLNAWQNTNQISSLEFPPRSLLAKRLLGWVLRMLALQMAVGTLAWAALQSTRSIAAGQDAAAWLQSSQNWPQLRDFAVAQIVAFLSLRLISVPVLRQRLQGHVEGMRELFGAIRDLALDLKAKPLPAGRGGELGYLSLAFNDMAAKLLASRNALVEANRDLELRVEARTRELREAAAKLDLMASTDALTGLSNRRRFALESQERFTRAERHQHDLVCLMADLDNFKMVNDQLGHKTGDEVLRLAADVLRAACRADDLVARFGGDEFVLVLELDDITIAQRIADRLVLEFRARAAEMLAGKGLKAMPSMSVGISSRKTSGARTFEEMLSAGDGALYAAKGQGKSRANVAPMRQVA